LATSLKYFTQLKKTGLASFSAKKRKERILAQVLLKELEKA